MQPTREDIRNQLNRLQLWLERASWMDDASRKETRQAIENNVRAGGKFIIDEVLKGTYTVQDLEVKAFGASIDYMFSKGYASGGYFIRCHKCEGQKIADKRAVTCHECAIKGWDNEIPNP